MKYLIFLFASFLNWQAFAWDITINPVNDNQMIWLKNTTAINQSNVYLAWFDLDDNKLLSYSVSKGWQNSLEPAFEKVVDLPTFESFPAVNIPAICPSKHRCFLAFVDVPPNTNVLDVEKWRNAAVLPLSAEAAYERLPNQTFFLTKYNLVPGDIFSGGAVATVASGTPAKADTTTSTTTTEKPDIFRKDGNKVLFANGAANKFQVIDVSDVNKPRLLAETTLKGTPKEIYAVNGFYAVMQSNNETSQLNVFSLYGSNIVTPIHIGDYYAHLPVFTWNLYPVSEQKFDGYFLQSRRRNDVIFSVNQSYDQNGVQLQLNATLVNSLGNVSTVDSNSLQGYNPKIAIFSDYLVIANDDYQDLGIISGGNIAGNNTTISVFDLSSAKPLSSPKQIKVAGYIPSEFHLNVQNQQLRVVYSPLFNSKEGSTLAIYDLSTPDLSLIGKIEKIAPNEALFATRFVGDMAYVVTYQRKDPLWAIDLSNPKQPTIKGELIVPGWSEFMFFNNNKLFAIGIDDQLAEGETWARRVSASLFDVANATDLKLNNKITPLFGKVSSTYSQATSDERALLLDWDQQIAAFPLESWKGQANSYLQILHLDPNKLIDGGLLELPLTPQRSLLLDQEKLGILSEQVFFTANIANNDPKLLGELELARNLQWLVKNQNNLFAAAYGNKGYYRLYQFDSTNPSKIVKTWSLQHGFYSVKSDDKLAIFFNQYPFEYQIFDFEKNMLYPAQTTEFKSDYWGVFQAINNNHFYSSTQQYINIQPLKGISEDTTSRITPYLWTLNRWRLENGKATPEKSLNLAGQPIVIKGDLIITQENEYSTNPRLNLLSFNEERAKFLKSLELDCQMNNSVWAEDSLYISCFKGGYYYDFPSGTYMTKQPEYKLLKIAIQQNRLQVVGQWSLTDRMQIFAASKNTILLGNYYAYYYGGVRPMMAVDSLIYNPTGSNCTLYRLETAQLTPLKKLDNCSGVDQTVLFEDKLFQTAGFANIQSISW